MLGYDFEVKYKPRADNKVVDALSCIPPTIHLAYLSAPALLNVHIIRDEVLKDPKLSDIILGRKCHQKLENENDLEESNYANNSFK